jgi:hypothetical protein
LVVGLGCAGTQTQREYERGHQDVFHRRSLRVANAEDGLFRRPLPKLPSILSS